MDETQNNEDEKQYNSCKNKIKNSEGRTENLINMGCQIAADCVLKGEILWEWGERPVALTTEVRKISQGLSWRSVTLTSTPMVLQVALWKQFFQREDIQSSWPVHIWILENWQAECVLKEKGQIVKVKDVIDYWRRTRNRNTVQWHKSLMNLGPPRHLKVGRKWRV